MEINLYKISNLLILLILYYIYIKMSNIKKFCCILQISIKNSIIALYKLFIRFATIEKIDQNMPFEFSIQPNTLIRVLMTYKGLGSITYHNSAVAPNGISLFPVQLIEVIFNILIFIYLFYRLYRKKEKQLNLISMCFILTASCKFLTDFFRASSKNIFLSSNQYVCLIFIFIGILIVILNKSKIIDKNYKT